MAKLVATINALDQGRASASELSSQATVFGRHVKATDARLLALQHLLKERSRLARARRDLGLTGVQKAAAVASLLKQSLDDFGYMKFSNV